MGNRFQNMSASEIASELYQLRTKQMKGDTSRSLAHEIDEAMAQLIQVHPPKGATLYSGEGTVGGSLCDLTLTMTTAGLACTATLIPAQAIPAQPPTQSAAQKPPAGPSRSSQLASVQARMFPGNDPVKSCQHCPSRIAAGEEARAAKEVGKVLGIDWCVTRAIPLGSLNSDKFQTDRIQRKLGESCERYGEPPVDPAAPRGAQEYGGRSGLPLGAVDGEYPRGTQPLSCSACRYHVPQSTMLASLGLPLAGCTSFGRVILPGREIASAATCGGGVEDHNAQEEGRRDTMRGLKLSGPYAGNITMIHVDGEGEPLDEPTPDPREYVSDQEVTGADEAAGIRAWRRIDDPDGTGNSVLMPIFDPARFDDVEQAKIPQTGDDEHPELYRDHQGLAYKMLVLWRHMNETPALNGVPGVGKGHPVSTEVLTSKGWRTVGSLAVGDEVIGSNGRPTRVEGVFPRGRLHVNRVRFSDGASVLVDDDHLWHVQTRRQRQDRGGYKVIATKDLGRLEYARGYKYTIPMVDPVQYDEATLPIDPYTLGVLLANGALGGGEAIYSTLDEHVIDKVASANWQVRRTSNTAHRIVVKRPYGRASNFRPNEIWRRLHDPALAGKRSAEKFIPTEYLHASESQRRDLLAALLDCDGSCDGRRTMYHTTSPRLAYGVRELVQSLGGTASVTAITSRDGGELRVAVHMPVNPFTTPKKAQRWDSVEHRSPSRRIVGIDDAGHDDVVCIQVAAEDHLYVTEDYIVTHNTEAFRYLAWMMQLPFERISITGSTEVDDLQGRFVLEGGETRFHYGRVPAAWQRPCVIVVDEPNVGPPEVWQFLRPLTDNSKQLAVDANKGERIDRNPHCFLGMAFNPSWDMRNVGTHEIADADGSRLMHIAVPEPDEKLERRILTERCKVDGYKLPEDTLKAIIKIAKDIRDLAKQDAFPIHWGTRQQIKVARSTQWFTLAQAYRLAAGDLIDPESNEQLAVIVKSHTPRPKN